MFNETQSDSEDDLDFDNLLDEGEDSFDLSDSGDNLNEPNLASDGEIDDIFAQMEAQADLEALEANSIDETALLDEMLDEDGVDNGSDSTDLLDELMDDNRLNQRSRVKKLIRLMS